MDGYGQEFVELLQLAPYCDLYLVEEGLYSLVEWAL